MGHVSSTNNNLEMFRKDIESKHTLSDSVHCFTHCIPELIEQAVQVSLGNGATEPELEPFRKLAVDLRNNQHHFIDAILAKGPQRDDPEPTESKDKPHDPALMSEQTTPKTAQPSPTNPTVGVPPVNPPAQPAGPNPTVNTGPSKPVTVPTNPNTPPKT